MEYTVTAAFLLAVVAGSFAAVIIGGFGIVQLIASALWRLRFLAADRSSVRRTMEPCWPTGFGNDPTTGASDWRRRRPPGAGTNVPCNARPGGDSGHPAQRPPGELERPEHYRVAVRRLCSAFSVNFPAPLADPARK